MLLFAKVSFPTDSSITTLYKESLIHWPHRPPLCCILGPQILVQVGGDIDISSQPLPSRRWERETAVSSTAGVVNPSGSNLFWPEREPPQSMRDLLNQNQCLKPLAAHVNFL